MEKKNILLAITLLCLIMTGCTLNSQDDVADSLQEQIEVSEEEKQDVVSEFLVEFFNFNCNGRYDTFMETVENDDSLVDIDADEEGIMPITQVQEKALETYYQDLAPYVTEECLDTMQANRLPVQLDKFTKEKGIEASVDYIELTKYDDNSYLYRVYFQENGDAYFEDGLAGQVSYEIVDGEIKVSVISIAQ